MDELATSDEYLARACEKADVFEVTWVTPKPPIERLLGQVSEAVTNTAGRAVERVLGRTRKEAIR